MIITGVTVNEFREAVAKAGVRYGDNLRAEIGREYSATRFGARVVLKATGAQIERAHGLRAGSLGLAPGQRRSGNVLGGMRRINAVCWHAYRDVLAELFDMAPSVKVRTALAAYLGRDSFYDQFPATGQRNIGSVMYPVTMPETCDC